MYTEDYFTMDSSSLKKRLTAWSLIAKEDNALLLDNVEVDNNSSLELTSDPWLSLCFHVGALTFKGTF